MKVGPNKLDTKQCRCPNCGYVKPRGGVPCYAQACPRCEAPMKGD